MNMSCIIRVSTHTKQKTTKATCQASSLKEQTHQLKMSNTSCLQLMTWPFLLVSVMGESPTTYNKTKGHGKVYYYNCSSTFSTVVFVVLVNILWTTLAPTIQLQGLHQRTATIVVHLIAIGAWAIARSLETTWSMISPVQNCYEIPTQIHYNMIKPTIITIIIILLRTFCQFLGVWVWTSNTQLLPQTIRSRGLLQSNSPPPQSAPDAWRRARGSGPLDRSCVCWPQRISATPNWALRAGLSNPSGTRFH